MLNHIPIYIRSSIPIERLKINKETIKTIGRLSYDSSHYDTNEKLNASFSNNVALIQKHIKSAPFLTLTIDVDNRCFHVSKNDVYNNGKKLTDSEIQDVMDFISNAPPP